MMRTTMAAGVLLALALTGCDIGTAADRENRAAPTSPETAPASPSPEAPASAEPMPVWWDVDGLHHGDVVEETAFPLEPDVGPFGKRPHLALVRTGALYGDPRTGDVWFHPWGGEPRVVGHGTAAGPGGDPEGDIASWFDGRQLVVYDTVSGSVVSRTREVGAVNRHVAYPEHVGHGNGWVHVSAEQVVWRSRGRLARRDLVTGTSEPAWHPVPSNPPAPRVFRGPPGTRPNTVRESFEDVSATSAVWSMPRNSRGTRATIIVDRAGMTGSRTMAGFEFPAVPRLSPDGAWLLTPEGSDGTHGVAVMDVRTGQVWKPLKRPTYVFYSWAYGDVAMLMTRSQGSGPSVSGLVSCRVTQKSCDELPTRGGIVLPNP